MSLRDINHQAAIDLGECDTEYVAALKQELDELRLELKALPRPCDSTSGTKRRRIVINQRLARIQELLAK
jgi:hypothetical protein